MSRRSGAFNDNSSVVTHGGRFRNPKTLHYPQCNDLCIGDLHYLDNVAPSVDVRTLHKLVRTLTGWSHGLFAEWADLEPLQKVWWETGARSLVSDPDQTPQDVRSLKLEGVSDDEWAPLFRPEVDR